MSSTLVLRRQIKSITGTKKVTKAMELVSGSKMRKSVSAVFAARPYSQEILDLVYHLRTEGVSLISLLGAREIKKVLFVALSSNRGLCGGFNAALGSSTFKAYKAEKEVGSEQVDVITVGKKIRDYFLRSGIKPIADFVKNDITRSARETLGLARLLSDWYEQKKVDKVILVYTHFVSSVKQHIVHKQLLPFTTNGNGNGHDTHGISSHEPSREELFHFLLPRCLEIQLYQAFLESEASEHSARMIAMHNASKAAQEMLDDLRLTYNQVRQTAITQEMAEISSAMTTLM